MATFEGHRVPDFLIIGAMKCGTTTLYRDLGSQPGIYFPYEKEPHSLNRDEVLSGEGLAAYGKLFEGARAEQKCGEASTGYTKRPNFEGAAGRARRLCGADLRLIYIVRDPIERAMSQYYHRVRLGGNPPTPEQALLGDPDYANWGRYAWQLEPWLEAFGRERVQVVLFEEFTRDRASACERACGHVGVEFRRELLDTGKAYNVGDKMIDARGGLLGKLRRSWAYRSLVRPAVPVGLRTRLRELMGKKPVARPQPPERSVLERFADLVRQDAARLAELMGRPGPVWDLGASVERALRPADSVRSE